MEILACPICKFEDLKLFVFEESEELTDRQRYIQRKERIKELELGGQTDTEEYKRCIRLDKSDEEMYPEWRE